MVRIKKKLHRRLLKEARQKKMKNGLKNIIKGGQGKSTEQLIEESELVTTVYLFGLIVILSFFMIWIIKEWKG